MEGYKGPGPSEMDVPDKKSAPSEVIGQCSICRASRGHLPDCAVINESARDFHNADLLAYALASGESEMRNQACEFLRAQGMSEARISDSILHQEQRQQIHQEIKENLVRRLSIDPIPTDDELNAGVYAEQLESHVRDAVFALRKKGYDTKGSGFGDIDVEKLYLSGENPSFSTLGKEVIEQLTSLGIQVADDGEAIKFLSAGKSVDEIKQTWDLIAQILPDLGHVAPQAKPYLGVFKYNSIRAGKLPPDPTFEAMWEKNHPKT
jgi:hypothetical protein